MKSIKLFMCLLIVLSFTGCKKYLDEKPDRRLVVPSSLTDLQALLDYYPNLLSDPVAEEVSADNYYLSDADWLSLPQESQRRMYTWEPDNVFEASSLNDWGVVYRRIYYANTVLDQMTSIPKTESNAAEWNNVMGQALFLRAKSFLQAANIWCQAYDSAAAGNLMGIPLKLHADLTEASTRSTMRETYDRIIAELKSAAGLLPVRPLHVTRSSRPAAFAYLSRAYLTMQQYPLAGVYADSCLQLFNTLIDYNTISTTATYPFTRFNAEVIYHTGGGSPAQLIAPRCRIDSNLFRSYAANDCRRTVFFTLNSNGSVSFKGSYDGNNAGFFTGVASDEMYLTRAECYARTGNVSAAVGDLNTLLQKRFKTNTFVPFVTSSVSETLAKILEERRKELLMRYSRWMDIKRLNKIGANIFLRRVINNINYALPPNDPRYALPIPEDIIRMTAMPQNPR